MGKKLLARGLPARTRTQNYHRKGLWAMKQRGPVPGVEKKRRRPGRPRTVKEKPFGTKGETRKVIRPRAPRVYHPDPIKHKAHYRKSKGTPPKIRKSLTPGSICIVLSGRCRGRRVVILQVLKSGLLLVTGPYKANGVPLRRINPAYVISTSTRIDISSVKLSEDLKDHFFKKIRSRKSKKGASDFLGKKVKPEQPKEPKESKEIVEAPAEEKEKESEKKKPKKAKKEEKKEGTKSSEQKKRKSGKKKKVLKKNKVSDKRIKLQKEVDEQLIPIIKKEPYLFDYLSSLFTLKQGEYPHLIKF